jgi:uncharacterized coiled-coil protein SlyX/enamine deaminase RidA (YjgF/YER057c/UK114 family)
MSKKKNKNKSQSKNPISQTSSDKPITVDVVHPEHKPSEEIKPSVSADHIIETKETLPVSTQPMDHQQPSYPQITVSQNMVYGSGIINLVPEPLYRQLQIENTELKEKIHNMKIQENLLLNSNQELRDTIKCNQLTIDELKKENLELRHEIEQLREKIKLLESKIVSQDSHITNLESKIVSQDSHIIKLESDIDDLKKRDEPITVREAFVSLEKHIFFEITGKKKSQRDTIQALFSNPVYKTKCAVFLKKYNITMDHIDTIASLKTPGNLSAHGKRPSIKQSYLINLAKSMLDDPTNLTDIKITEDLFGILEKYVPVNSDGIWNIISP